MVGSSSLSEELWCRNQLMLFCAPNHSLRLNLFLTSIPFHNFCPNCEILYVMLKMKQTNPKNQNQNNCRVFLAAFLPLKQTEKQLIKSSAL